MSQKTHHKHGKIAKPDLLDQENDPFLKNISRKVRNINKKLTEIAELQKKQNLKVQQIEKINRKEQLIKDRNKIEDVRELYRQSYKENAEHYRREQLKEVENIAKAVTIFHTFPDFQGHKQLSSFWEALNNVRGKTLSMAVQNLAQTLRSFADNKKLQQDLNSFTVQHAETTVKPQEQVGSITPILLSDKATEVRTHINETEAYTKKTMDQNGEPVLTKVIQKIGDGVVQSVKVQIDQAEKVEKSGARQHKKQFEQPLTPPPTPVDIKPGHYNPVPLQEELHQKSKTQLEQKIHQNRQHHVPKERKDRREYKQYWQPREHKEHREHRQNGNRRHHEGRQRKHYRPKQQDRQPPQHEDNLSSDSSEELKRFRQDQIQKLQEQGFIVVGKPKQKPVPFSGHSSKNHPRKPRQPHPPHQDK